MSKPTSAMGPFAFGIVCPGLNSADRLCAKPDHLCLPPIVIFTIDPTIYFDFAGVCSGCVISNTVQQKSRTETLPSIRTARLSLSASSPMPTADNHPSIQLYVIRKRNGSRRKVIVAESPMFLPRGSSLACPPPASLYCSIARHVHIETCQLATEPEYVLSIL